MRLVPENAEIWSTMKNQEKRLWVNDMGMLQWMCGVTKKDNIRNEHVRESVKVAPVTKKIRNEGYVLGRMLDAPVPGL